MATLYAVGIVGSVTWDGVTNRFATASGGAATVAAPTAADDVILDASSGAGTLTTSAASTCKTLTCTGFTGTLSGGATVAGSVTFGSGMTTTSGSTGWTITAAATLTSSGKAFQNTLSLSPGTANTVQLGDALTANGGSGVQWNTGNFTTNGFSLTVTVFTSSNSNTRALALGSSSVTVSGASATTWNCATATGMTVTATTATITLSGASSSFNGGVAFWPCTVTLTGANTAGFFLGTGGGVVNVTRTGTATKTDALQFGQNQTVITGNLTVTGNSVTNRMNVVSSTVGAQRALVVGGTATFSNADLQDMLVQGQVVWTVGGAGGNLLSANQSSLETDTSGWVAGNNATVARSTAQALTGAASLKVTATAGAATLTEGTGAAVAVTPGQTVTVMAALLGGAAVASAQVKLRFYSDAGGNTQTGSTQFGNSFVAQTAAWQGSVVSAVAPAGTQTARVIIAFNAGSAGDFVYADGIGMWTTAPVLDLSAATGGSGDAGGNSGITFTASATQTHTASAGGNWSDVTKWTSRVPLPQDDVVVNVNTTGTLTIDMPRLGRSINFTGFAGTLSIGTGASCYGSWTFASGMTVSGANGVVFAGRGSYTITSAGKQFSGSLTLAAPGGTYQPQDALSTASTLQLQAGTLDLTLNFSVTSQILNTSGTTTKSIAAGTSTTWSVTQTTATTVWSAPTSVGLTITGTLNVTISTTSANARTFASGGFTYGALTYTVAGSTGGLVLTGANIFAAINFSDATNARTLTLPASTVTTLGQFSGIVGTAGKLMSVVSSTGGTAAQLRPTAGATVPFNTDYLSLQDIAAQSSTGGAGTGIWYAGHNSTDVSGNSGWTFATGFAAAITDTATATDVAARAVTVARGASDTATAAGTSARLLTSARSVADTAASTDLAAGTVAAARTFADTATAAATTTRTIAAARSVADTAAASDVVNAGTVTARAISDTAAVSATVARATAATRNITDGATANDTTAAGIASTRTSSDTAAVSDSIGRAETLNRTASDTANASDSIARATFRQRTVSDTATISDTAGGLTAAARTVSDTAGVTDVLGRQVTLHAAVADTASAASSSRAGVTLHRTATDTAAVSDAISTARTLQRAFIDATSASDAIVVVYVPAGVSERGRIGVTYPIGPDLTASPGAGATLTGGTSRSGSNPTLTGGATL